jgi:hypothetical protein
VLSSRNCSRLSRCRARRPRYRTAKQEVASEPLRSIPRRRTGCAPRPGLQCKFHGGCVTIRVTPQPCCVAQGDPPSGSRPIEALGTCHSTLSASVGASRSARPAGIADVTATIPTITNAASAVVGQSPGETQYRSDDTVLESHAPTTSPARLPVAAAMTASPITRRRIRDGVAPTAMRQAPPAPAIATPPPLRKRSYGVVSPKLAA